MIKRFVAQSLDASLVYGLVLEGWISILLSSENVCSEEGPSQSQRKQCL
jgi:hypothetical protein